MGVPAANPYGGLGTNPHANRYAGELPLELVKYEGKWMTKEEAAARAAAKAAHVYFAQHNPCRIPVFDPQPEAKASGGAGQENG